MTAREAAYAVLVALGVAAPMYFNVQVLQAGGNLLLDFFTVPLEDPITASVLVDLLIAFAAYNVLLLTEGRSLGRGSFWLCLAVSWLISFAAGLPLFLLLRERLRRRGTAVQARSIR